MSSDFNDINARFSPDGKWLAYSSNESGEYEIYVRPFNPSSSSGSPTAGGKWMVSKSGAGQGGAFWRADGKELFYIGPDQTLMSTEISTSPEFKPAVPKPLFKVPSNRILFVAVSGDGKRFLFPVPIDTASTPPPYKVVLNWTSTLKK